MENIKRPSIQKRREKIISDYENYKKELIEIKYMYGKKKKKIKSIFKRFLMKY